MIRLVPFLPEHAAMLELRPGAAAVLNRIGPRKRLARTYAAAGPAWTLLWSDDVAACGGVVRFWPGVGELWCWTGAPADGCGLAFARRTRLAVNGLFRTHGFHRLQAHVRLDDARARRFARFLGLAPEGECPGYGPDGATYQLYGRVQWRQ